MFNLKKAEVVDIANKNDFIVNNAEKVLRLISILNYISESDISKYLALKGGTAINLFLLNLPRLSVDIDFDFIFNYSKAEIGIIRNSIRDFINRYMIDEGYFVNDRTKFVHTLDSFVFSYNTASRSKDVLKIEINYSNRLHIMPTICDESSTILGTSVSSNRLNNYELIASKINALISRTVPRDVYDVFNIFKKGIDDIELIKKITLFYIAFEEPTPIDFNELLNKCIGKIQLLNYNKLRETLIPLLHKKEKLNIEEIKTFVIDKIKEVFILDEEEKEFIKQLNLGNFNQKLLFGDSIKEDLSKHPMIIWKTQNNNQS